MNSRRLWLSDLKKNNACRASRRKFFRATGLYTKVTPTYEWSHWAARHITFGEVCWLAHAFFGHPTYVEFCNYKNSLMRDFKRSIEEGYADFGDAPFYLRKLVLKFAELYVENNHD